jgi:hypothetical protein
VDGLAEDGGIEEGDAGDVFRSAGEGAGGEEEKEQGGGLARDEHGGPLVGLSAGMEAE